MAQTEQRFEELSFSFEPKDRFLNESECKKAHKLHEEGLTWAEVAEELGYDASVRLMAHIHREGLIMFRSEKELARQIQRARDAGESWAGIGARAGGMTERRVQKLYEQATDKNYFETYIEHGGRPRHDGLGFQGIENGEPVINTDPTVKPTKEKATKKSSSKKAKAKSNDAPEFDFAKDADKNEVRDTVAKELEGKTVTVERSSGTEDVTVAKVLAAAYSSKRSEWGLQVQDDDEDRKVFAINAIKAVA